MLLWIFICFGVMVSGFQMHLSPMRHNQKHLFKRQSADEKYYMGPLVPSYNFSMPFDHFNTSDERRYNNRYWVNDTYYQPGGPVFFLDNGELGVSNYTAAAWLAEVNGTSAVMELARRYNGLAIMWELRYYGNSTLFPINTTDDGGAISFFGHEPVDAPESWQFNTVEQALADVAYFAANISNGPYQNGNMTALLPQNTPWIWVGGSYPGIRGAWMRVRTLKS